MSTATKNLMSEIFPSIHRFDVPLGSRFMAQYALIAERCYLVDTGISSTPKDAIFPYLKQIGMGPDNLAAVFITHPDADHCGGNAAVRAWAPHAPIVAHTEDAALMENSDFCIAERYDFSEPYGYPLEAERAAGLRKRLGEAVPVDVRIDAPVRLHVSEKCIMDVIHAPGHSKGHLVFWEPSQRVALIADAVLGGYLPDKEGRPLFAPTYRYKQDYLATIAKLRTLQAECLLSSHFPVMQGAEVTAFLNQSETFVKRLDEAIHDCFITSKKELSLADLIQAVQPGLADWANPDSTHVAYSLCYPVAATLDDGVARGFINVERRKDMNFYSLKQ